jgi:hypothetical protein
MGVLMKPILAFPKRLLDHALGLVALLSLILYVRDLGFYSDDWDFLGRMGLSPDQSLTGLFRAFYVPDEGVWMRPVQGLYLISLYWLFGLHPLGYHLVNAAMLVAVGIVFHLVLCALKQPRLPPSRFAPCRS